MPSRHEEVLDLDFFFLFSLSTNSSCSCQFVLFHDESSLYPEYSHLVLNLKPCLDLLKLMSECNLQSLHLTFTNCQLACGFNLAHQYRAFYISEFAWYFPSLVFRVPFKAKGKYKVLCEVMSSIIH